MSQQPPLVSVSRVFAGDTIERALYLFESECSQELVDTVRVISRAPDANGTLVHYEVHHKDSVFDDHAYRTYEAWAVVAAKADQFHVVAASAEHHDL